MYSKQGFLFICVMILSTANLNAQETNYRIYENGTEITYPDSLENRITEGIATSREILIKWLAAEGYLNAEIDSIGSTCAVITRNCKFLLQKITIKYKGETDSVRTIYPEIDYTQNVLQNEIRRLIVELNQDGYPFAKSGIERFLPDYNECTISITLQLDPGERSEAAGIYFSGHRSNSQEYLRKISRFQTGEIITPDYLRYLRANLVASELFNDVEEGQILLRGGEPVIVFKVQERTLNQLDGLLGYVPNPKGNGQIVGDLELSFWNVLTEGSGLSFQYQRLRPETSELDVGIWQNWIRGFPIGLSAGFNFYQNDTTYQSRQFQLEGSYRVSGGFKLIGGIELQSSISGSGLPVVVEPDGSKRTARLGFEYTNLDRYDVPTKGNSISISYGIAHKDLQDDSTGIFAQNILELEARQYFSVFDRSVIALSLHGFILEADRVTLNDLTRFGGANSFRGYAEDQFRAGQLLWGDVEYQFLLDRQSFLFAFGAYGAYQRPILFNETNNDFMSTGKLYSLGFGLSYQTRIGRLKFTYAISPEDNFTNGKVHFGVRTEL
jgi:outer membrane protein assembly factor BamA